jgi:hypothetical protein
MRRARPIIFLDQLHLKGRRLRYRDQASGWATPHHAGRAGTASVSARPRGRGRAAAANGLHQVGSGLLEV